MMRDLANREIVIIGLGGIGGRLLRELVPYLSSSKYHGRLVIVDGDQFEPKNRGRQEFVELGPKAVVLAKMYDGWGLDIHPESEYVTEDNVAQLVREGCVVLLGVDNHATRLVVSEYCVELDDVLLISGGNDYTDGNVQVYLREGGLPYHPPIHDPRIHPEIAHPDDHNPAEMGCELLVATSEPQLGFMNNLIAALMCGVFYTWHLGRALKSEVYADLTTQSCRATDRPLE